ncbi:rod shape-determining protein MreC [Pedomonas mirosovicensis]|uniref:rod shape-determining protein MreC n=1 Tax=Pedomonas mirosovicensis TaxID=2908641 RepID=UPI002168E1D0|nr:rod shape-determining protein MreC [Pedomonas mirosovicensis]MCH8684806.1 rod shape-determining protein MreC [Pedomonas mirosovicensis]
MPLPQGATPSYQPARWRWFLSRVLIVVLVLAGALLMVLNRSSVRFGDGLTQAALDGVAPVLSAMRAPFEWVKIASNEVESYFLVRSRNQELLREQVRLKEIESRYRTVLAENRRLKQLLGITEPSPDVVGAARIVGSTAGSYVRSAIILRGARDGVAKGQPVRDSDGLVGQVIDVGHASARILLLTDLASRIPVRVEESNRTAIAAGMNEKDLLLQFLSPGPPLRAGDRLVTSGDGGTFPPGIPVAIVTEPRGPEPRARPLANPGGLDFVAILRPFMPEATIHPQNALTLDGTTPDGPQAIAKPPFPVPSKPLPGVQPAPDEPAASAAAQPTNASQTKPANAPQARSANAPQAQGAASRQ